MPKLNKQQQKRYEEVREWLKSILILAKAPEQGDVPFEEFWATQILSDPRIAILDEERSLPPCPEWSDSKANYKGKVVIVPDDEEKR